MTRDAGPRGPELEGEITCPHCRGRRAEHAFHINLGGDHRPCTHRCMECAGTGRVVVGPWARG